MMVVRITSFSFYSVCKLTTLYSAQVCLCQCTGRAGERRVQGVRRNPAPCSHFEDLFRHFAGHLYSRSATTIQFILHKVQHNHYKKKLYTLERLKVDFYVYYELSQILSNILLKKKYEFCEILKNNLEIFVEIEPINLSQYQSFPFLCKST